MFLRIWWNETHSAWRPVHMVVVMLPGERISTLMTFVDKYTRYLGDSAHCLRHGARLSKASSWDRCHLHHPHCKRILSRQARRVEIAQKHAHRDGNIVGVAYNKFTSSMCTHLELLSSSSSSSGSYLTTLMPVEAWWSSWTNMQQGIPVLEDQLSTDQKKMTMQSGIRYLCNETSFLAVWQSKCPVTH